MPVPATPDNMRRYPGHIAYSPETGEEYSGTAGDYFTWPDDRPLEDANAEPMILVRKRTIYLDADIPR